MNRDIKFRAWIKSPYDTMVQAEDILNFGLDCGKIIYAESEEHDMDKGTFELMQYTGLKDSYGVEIYEGDILAFEDEKEFKWLVKYDYDSFIAKGGEHNQEEGLIEFYDWNRDRLDVVVLGNIYENPKLLKEDTDERI